MVCTIVYERQRFSFVVDSMTIPFEKGNAVSRRLVIHGFEAEVGTFGLLKG